MNRLYFRCNGGHYFAARVACPWDGWSCEGLEHAIDVFDGLSETGFATVEELRQRGVSSEVMARVVLIDFGSEASAFHALAPARYIHRGREVLAHEVETDLY